MASRILPGQRRERPARKGTKTIRNEDHGRPNDPHPGIIIDGASLTCDGVAAVARDEAPVTIAAGAVAAARAAWETAREVAARRPVYGRTTGVGANRNVGLAER